MGDSLLLSVVEWSKGLAQLRVVCQSRLSLNDIQFIVTLRTIRFVTLVVLVE